MLFRLQPPLRVHPAVDAADEKSQTSGQSVRIYTDERLLIPMEVVNPLNLNSRPGRLGGYRRSALR